MCKIQHHFLGSDLNPNPKPLFPNQVTCLLGAKRQPYYYTTNIIVPVVLLNILNFLTFFLDSEQVETKVKSSGILMVALLAFQATVTPSLPVTGYPTALHNFMVYSQVCVESTQEYISYFPGSLTRALSLFLSDPPPLLCACSFSSWSARYTQLSCTPSSITGLRNTNPNPCTST